MPMVEEGVVVIKRYDDEGNEIIPEGPRVYLCILELLNDERIWDMFMGFKDGADSPEGKAYYTGMDGSLKSTREETFLYLQTMLPETNILKSFVMTQNQTLKTNITVYSFMRMCLESDKVISATAEITVEDLNDHLISIDPMVHPDELWVKEME